MRRSTHSPTCLSESRRNRKISTPRNDRSYETFKPDTPSVDKFYASKGIAYLFYYSNLDLTTVKRLARLVIGEPMQRQPSEELFGTVFEASERGKERSTGSRAPVVRRLLPKLEEDESEGEQEEEPDFEQDDFSAIELELGLARPGEKNWEWIQFSLPPEIATYLARLWEGLEKLYVDSLKELLLVKSVHLSRILSYKSFVTKAMTEFINRPHNKQDLLHEFHEAFNAIDDDARNDVDVKCELHRRVADFQAQLWQISDERKHESEEERQKYIRDQWTVLEATLLFNIYIGIIQIEMDRCVDTIRLLQDYYLGMLMRPLQEIRFPKFTLNKMEVSSTVGTDYNVAPMEKLNGRKEMTDRSTVKGGSLKSAAASPAAVPPAVEHLALQKEINDFLFNRNKPFNDADGISIFKTIVENVRCMKSIVDGIATATNEILGREEAAASKNRDYAIDPGDSTDPKQMASRVKDLLLEWRYAIGYEIARIRLRLDTLIAAARSDIAFLLSTMQKTFYHIYDTNIDR